MCCCEDGCESDVVVVGCISKGVESNFVPYDRYKYRSRAQLQMIPASEPVVTISIDMVFRQQIRMTIGACRFSRCDDSVA